MARTPRDNQELWREYLNTRTDRARNAIVVLYLDQADRQAERKNASTPGSVSVDELRSAAHGGLIQAIEKYDPSTGVPEGAFISQKIEFAMLDWLRHIDIVPRRSGGEYPIAVNYKPDSIDANYTTEDVEVSDGWAAGCGVELDQWVSQLYELEQMVISMHYRMGMSMSVIASVIGETRDVASSIHCRALHELKRLAAGVEVD